jgi:hypothetical protein
MPRALHHPMSGDSKFLSIICILVRGPGPFYRFSDPFLRLLIYSVSDAARSVAGRRIDEHLLYVENPRESDRSLDRLGSTAAEPTASVSGTTTRTAFCAFFKISLPTPVFQLCWHHSKSIRAVGPVTQSLLPSRLQSPRANHGYRIGSRL